MSYQLRPSQPTTPQEGGFNIYNNNAYGQQNHGYGYGQQAYGKPLPPAPSPVSPPPNVAAMMYTHEGYPHEGIVRTQTWVSNQPSVMSPPPVAKTPFSDWTAATDSTFDRRTLGAYSVNMPPRPPKDRRICGIKRTAFLIVMAIGLFLLVVAISVGLGVGLGSRKSTDVAADSAAANLGADSSSSSTSTSPTATTSTSPTSAKISPTPSFTGTLIAGPVVCPQNNNTVYVAQGSSKPFNVQCGRDYSSANGGRDISHMHTSTMAQCIDVCGQRGDCVGVGWGYYQGSYQCWMKSKLGEPNWSSEWYFAQLQNMNDL
ncbi:hypothetical protein F5Y13DRAFT_188990 [Hypoxylon sp. FL1857]|nr:hypothetical protein F5Y13DRAFT_188990 [Hypoxylon sp. FL1857]